MAWQVVEVVALLAVLQDFLIAGVEEMEGLAVRRAVLVGTMDTVVAADSAVDGAVREEAGLAVAPSEGGASVARRSRHRLRRRIPAADTPGNERPESWRGHSRSSCCPWPQPCHPSWSIDYALSLVPPLGSDLAPSCSGRLRLGRPA